MSEFVYDVDKEAFREATQPMIEAYEEEYPGVKTLMDTIEKARGGVSHEKHLCNDLNSDG